MENQERLELPSLHQINDRVNVYLGKAGKITGCSVIKVHFTESKVFYDVYVKEAQTRLYNIESNFIAKVLNTGAK